MTQGALIALIVAIGAGMAIALQATMITSAAQAIGPVRAGFMLHITGAAIALILIVGMTFAGQGIQTWGMTRPALINLILGGLIGLFVASGVGFALSRIGLAAGQVTIILGQVSLALLIDSMGWSATGAIPLDWRRILGVVLLVAATYFLLPVRE